MNSAGSCMESMYRLCDLNLRRSPVVNFCPLSMRNGSDQSSAGRRVHSQDGFALVVALTLMSFIVMLLLSLSIFAQVERRAAGAFMELLRAQENAQLGLVLALGRIQSLSGADQRYTAHADALSIHNAGVSVSDGNRHWAGVWDSTIDDPKMGFLGWLVSDLGSINRDLFDSAAVSLAAVPDLLTLVGKNTVELLQADGSPTLAEVRLPRVPIAQKGSGGGAYAFWVSDEGTKARFDLPDEFAASAPREDEEGRLLNGLRFAQPVKSELRAVLPTLDYRPEDAEFSESLKRLFDSGEAGLLSAALSDFVKEHYHDVTTASMGLLTNVRDGGLKKDLYRELDDGWTDSALRNKPVYAVSGTEGPHWNLFHEYFNLYARLDSRDGLTPSVAPYAPRTVSGDALSAGAFDDTLSGAPAQSGASKDSDSEALAEGGLHPLLMRVAIKIMPVTRQMAVTPGVMESRVEMRTFAYVTLWNPYNVELKAESYTIRVAADGHEFRVRTSSDTEIRASGSDPNIDIQGHPFFQNNRYLKDAVVASSDAHTVTLDLHFDTESIAFSPGEILGFGLDLDADTPTRRILSTV